MSACAKYYALPYSARVLDNVFLARCRVGNPYYKLPRTAGLTAVVLAASWFLSLL